jgi:menaquinol-cytochrome c reductase iron-sulfur subunit
MCTAHNCEKPTRRNFFKEGLCIAIGTLISVIPFAAGLAVYFDPMRRKSAGPSSAIRVASLSALPEDGIPRKFAVVADKSDAWNKYPNVIPFVLMLAALWIMLQSAKHFFVRVTTAPLH